MKLTLNALFDYTNDDGIFTYLNGFDVPWKNDVDSDLLDLDYHSKHGTKIVSKTVTSLLSDDGLSSANKTKLAKLLYQKNKARWDNLWLTLGLYDEFNPLDNTDWEETRTLTHEGEDSRSQSIGAKSTTYTKGSQTNSETIGQSTLTEGQQNNITGQQTISMEEKKSAFNSSNYSPLDQKTEQLGQRSDTIGQKVNTDSGRSNSSTEGQRSDSTNEGAQSNSESGSNEYTDTETIARHGNIGVTTAGQLIRDFRNTVNWQFFEIIYKDIDEMLVIEVYGREDDDFDDYTIVTGYVLPIASANVLGGIKVGQNLQIAADGTLKAIVEAGDVQSVNGKTGVVVLTASDVGAITAEDVPVKKVNNKTGDVVLGASDVGAATSQDISDAISQVRQVPSGGTTGNVLTKTSDGYGWAESSGGGSLKLESVYHGTTSLSRPLAFKIDNKTISLIGVPTGFGYQYQNYEIPFYDDIENIYSYLCMLGDNNHVLWDGKIGFLMGNPGSSSGGQSLSNGPVDLLIKTGNAQYVNDVTSYWLTWKDTANAEWSQDILDNVNHLAIGGCQYNPYTGNNKLAVYYTDENDVEHELTDFTEHVLAKDNKFFVICKDLNNLYIKSLRIVSASGYRCGYTIGYY